jgi:putative oxygen-independent coproporphyrinogen III oxidase
MPSALPDGEPVPSDGALPVGVAEHAGSNGFGVYVHIPFCATRCGYCDFNTYTADEAGQEGYLDALLTELKLAGKVLHRPVETIFVGGGTPTLLDPRDLGRILDGIDATWGIAAGAEITTEANPESVTAASLRDLRTAGFTRISLGMQSAAPNVLAVLDRRHTPGRAPQAATEARAAGFEHVNLDLIYGTPGESAEDFATSLDVAVGAGVDHVSAYSLIVEDGTRMAARMRRGELPYPSDDVAADRYLAAEATLSAAGFAWYEVSNWATSEAARCRHNLLYWTGGDWWGLGPGSGYAKRLADGVSPGHGRELLTAADRHVEDVMLRVRLAEGLPLAALDQAGLAGAATALDDGLLDPAAYVRGKAVLTLRGRLLADAVVRDLLP